jgi:trans-AT polyketide synthase/acyltransferase/oxidoreductase domain-containing protein
MNSKSLTYLFPGQGAQKAGMGKLLFPEFPEQVSAADRILGYSLEELCVRDPRQELVQTQFTQPALYAVSCLSYLKESRDQPFAGQVYAAGHSVGEYSALYAAGCFSFEDGLRLVKKRGELMSLVKGGGMAAVIGKTAEEIEKLLHQFAYDTIDVANYNSREQTVISGLAQEIADVRKLFEESGVRMYVPLKVSGAFHSRYMADTAEKFRQFLEPFEFRAPKFPVIANVHARPYASAEIKQTLARQIASPVQWSKSMEYLRGLGEMEFRELGESKILTNLLRQV